MTTKTLTIGPMNRDAVIEDAALRIVKDWDCWERGGTSPAPLDYCLATEQALDASGFYWPGATLDGLDFVADALWEWLESDPVELRVTEQDDAARAIATWIVDCITAE